LEHKLNGYTIESINEVLGENTIQDAYDSGLDISPAKASTSHRLYGGG
jgi:hypothetical protein